MKEDLNRELKRLLDHEFADGEETEKPIVVVGPSEKPKTMLRVYAYGGCLGRVRTRNGNYNRLADVNYAKYLKNIDPDENASLRLEKMLKKNCGKKKSDLLFEPEYLNLILKAAKIRFTKIGGNIQERRIQTNIVRTHMYKGQSDGWCIVDMEYAISENKHLSKPDLIVLDKDRGFGMIELKYDNKNMGNLSKHYIDSRKAANDPKRYVTELKRRCEYLTESGLADQALYGASKKDQRFWYGFLFVGGEKATSVNAVKKAAKERPDLIGDESCRFWWYPQEELAQMDLRFDAGQTYGGFTTD